MIRFFIIIFILFSFNAYTHDISDDYQENRDPALIIRFNQAHVYYDSSLKLVINKALKINKNAEFMIESLIPQIKDKEKQAILVQMANNNSNAVIYSFRKFGINPQNIKVENILSSKVTYHELHIYMM